MNTKKLICMISALALMTAPFTVYAEDITLNENEDPHAVSYGDEHNKRNTRISTLVMPTFTVSIPADANVSYGVQHTDLGSVELTSARLEPNSTVTVTLEASNTLKNDVSAEAVINYSITEGTAELPADTAYTQSVFTAEGDKTDLVINITDEEWKKAKAGFYSDTLTFTVEYSGRAPSQWTQQPS